MTVGPQRHAAPHHVPTGTILEGRYEIYRAIAEGGFATVYEGRQLNIDRRVAIKVLNLIDDADVQKLIEEKFVIEARASAQIQHPNVVTIFDYGLMDATRQPYIVMELLEGHHLGDALAEGGAMAPKRAFRLLLPALEALAEAHRLGIVHRDLKPPNLFIVHPGTERELLKVVDFGVARIWAMQAISRTGNGQLLGSPRDLAPEYLAGNVATPALDVYQMTLILLEMLTGHPVVEALNAFECIWAHTHGALPLPVDLMNGPLGPVLLRALDADYEARYPDAAALRKALRDPALAQIQTPGPETRPLSSYVGARPAAPVVAEFDGDAQEAIIHETIALRRAEGEDVHALPTTLVDPIALKPDLDWMDEEESTDVLSARGRHRILPDPLEETPSEHTSIFPSERAASLSEDEDSLGDKETSVWNEKHLKALGLRSQGSPQAPDQGAASPEPEAVDEAGAADEGHPSDEAPSAREAAKGAAPTPARRRRHNEAPQILRATAHSASDRGIADPAAPPPETDRWAEWRSLVILASVVTGTLLFITALIFILLAVFSD